MSRGRRYNGERKLNMKKVFAVIITFIAIIACIIGIKQLLKADKQSLASKNIELNYFTLFTNGNWGVINSSGETIIEPAYAEMIVIPNKAKPVFVCTYEVNYVDGTYKTKVVNEKNQEIFTGYQNVLVLQNYDENNKLWLEENVLKVQKEGKFGLINLDGTEVLPCEYDSITTLKGIKNSLVIKKDGKVGLVNSTGTIIIPAEYAEISALTNNYQNGYIVKNAESKFGVIKSDGKVALECKYDDIKHLIDNNMYIVKSEDKWVVLLEDGTMHLEGKVSEAKDINNGNVIFAENGKYGIMNITSEVLVANEYEDLTYMFEDKYIAKRNGNFGVINLKNEMIVDFKYSNIEYNHTTDYIKAKKEDSTYDYMTRDFAIKLTAIEEKVLNGYISIENYGVVKYYNYKLEEKSNKDVYSSNTLFVSRKDGKYGFVDKDGNVIVENIYDEAKEQNAYGYSAVKKDGKWGAIDQYGKIAVTPTYTITSNEVIDFIGKWHISADANANYYTDVQ